MMRSILVALALALASTASAFTTPVYNLPCVRPHPLFSPKRHFMEGALRHIYVTFSLKRDSLAAGTRGDPGAPCCGDDLRHARPLRCCLVFPHAGSIPSLSLSEECGTVTENLIHLMAFQEDPITPGGEAPAPVKRTTGFGNIFKNVGDGTVPFRSFDADALISDGLLPTPVLHPMMGNSSRPHRRSFSLRTCIQR